MVWSWGGDADCYVMCGRVELSDAQRLLGEGVSMSAVAKSLNLSRRLLQRRLAELDGGGA